MLQCLFLSVIPEAIIHPLSDELQRWLGPKEILRGHVKVVHEGKELFASNGHVDPFGPLLHLALNDLLDIVGRGLQIMTEEWRNIAQVSIRDS